MESVGQKLRAARLRPGLALEDISAKTRITVSNLQAIEADDLSHFDSRFFYKSFVRQFADAVGVDRTEVEGLLQTNAGAMPEPLMPGQPGAPVRPRLASLRPQRFPLSRWMYSMTSLVVVLMACSMLYSMWENSRASRAASLDRVQKPVLNSPQLQPAAPNVRPAAQPGPDPIAQAANRETFHLQLSAIERAWVSVATDGKEVYTGVLQPDQTKTLEGQETARVRTGNAGGVQVVFNGKTLGTLGSEGQVRTVLFSKNGYEILEPQAGILLTRFNPTE